MYVEMGFGDFSILWVKLLTLGGLNSPTGWGTSSPFLHGIVRIQKIWLYSYCRGNDETISNVENLIFFIFNDNKLMDGRVRPHVIRITNQMLESHMNV